MDMKEVAKFETKVGTLKLSEAIRIGAKIRPQCTGTPFDSGGSCAIGAAAEALGMPYSESAATKDASWYVSKLIFGYRHAMYERGLSYAIWTRNDIDGMTREQIADWLEAQGL